VHSTVLEVDMCLLVMRGVLKLGGELN
jgi:hypothetical protein